MYKEFIKTATVKAKLFERGDEDGIVHGQPFIKTLENDAHYGHFGKHYLCTGIDGERWLVEKSIFERTYEQVNEPEREGKELSDAEIEQYAMENFPVKTVVVPSGRGFDKVDGNLPSRTIFINAVNWAKERLSK